VRDGRLFLPDLRMPLLVAFPLPPLDLPPPACISTSNNNQSKRTDSRKALDNIWKTRAFPAQCGTHM